MTKKRGRPRKPIESIPRHIDQSALPKGIYWDATGSGRWYTIDYEDGRPARRTIAQRDAKLSELHALVEGSHDSSRRSLNYMLDRLHEAEEIKNLEKRTQDDYSRYKEIVARLQTSGGARLGDLDRYRLTLPFMQRLIDRIGKDTPTKANHLLRYLRRAFTWGVQRGYSPHNPLKGIKAPQEAKQVRVPSRSTLDKLTEFAKLRGAFTGRAKGSVAPYIWIVMELGYLCRLRPVEVITLTDANQKKVGVLSNRRKGSRDNITRFDERLSCAWEGAMRLRSATWARSARPIPHRPQDRFVIISETGEPLNRSSLDSAWQRFMRVAVQAKVIADDERFGMHALKHRGITDTPGTRHEKQRASGHKTEAMMDIYDHEIPVVDPVKGGAEE